MKQRLLITGATGMLGATLFKIFRKEYEVFATGSSVNPLEFIDNYLEFDLSYSKYDKLIEWSQPDVIIHCAALTNGNYCDQHPNKALDINGLSLEKLINALLKDTHIIYISSDAVFSNNMHNANENDCVNPQSVYGKSKELGEFFLKHSQSTYTIVRTTIVGLNQNKNKQGFVEWIINSSINKEEITLFDDVIFTPITIWNLADNLKYIINNKEKFSKSTIHISGSEICTKYDFGIALLNKLNLPSSNVKKGKIIDYIDRAKRSTDQTLNSKLFEKLSEIKLPDLKQTIQEIKINYNEKY